MEDRIGPALRKAREERKLGLRKVAAAAGISASLLSQVETGRSQPSVSTLYALVSHLGISLDELLGISVGQAEPVAGEPAERPVPRVPSGVVQRAADNPVLEMANGVRWERLAVGGQADVDALLVTYQPGAASSADRKLMRHSGTEYAYLLSGELTLLLDFDRHVLVAGDSLCFDSTRPHLYLNHGSEPARGVWFVSGRRDLDHTREWVESQVGGFSGGASSRPSNVVEALALLGPSVSVSPAETE
ncbi:Helix-turn-helix domain-containing protein [Amycolatopsis lurida]|uniref:XRE family transcriptional regulator n=1 Tax=Amycolatopsis lurida NRRL 2430 TaxID=1460371 RepID=A0A2P2FYT1_AMYLU|nr:helix-turn-helix transcriptional regulator [Amycolatopsis lurida]KFU81874.1 XRE family transcriptional regulator [Amycolatopsis lurida NRRL 2430]SEB32329.1 Helix-turn-helix domain-containing protein [Amycolatopsis lurida]